LPCRSARCPNFLLACKPLTLCILLAPSDYSEGSGSPGDGVTTSSQSSCSDSRRYDERSATTLEYSTLLVVCARGPMLRSAYARTAFTNASSGNKHSGDVRANNRHAPLRALRKEINQRTSTCAFPLLSYCEAGSILYSATSGTQKLI
jgi:hypothetical protein